MSEYKHGEMPIEEHEKTFAAFINVVKNVVIAVVLILIFLAVFNS